MPVTANCNSIADVREAIETAKVIRGIATEQRVEPMREVEKPPGSVRLMHESGLPVHEDAVSGGDLTGDKCPVCEGSRMTNGVVCEGCRGSGLVREASQKDDPPVKDPYEFDDVEDLEEDDAAVAAYMDDLEPDEDEPTATSVNSGKKKKRPESTARQHSNSQTATEPDNSFDAVMGPDDMQESGRIAPDWFVLGYRGPNDPDYLAAREMEESAASRADDGGVGLLAVCGLPTIQD